MLDRPALGVLGVHRLVQRDAEAAQDRPPLECAGGDLGARAEQRLGVEVDGAGVDLDVPGVRQPWSDQRPYRIQALEDRRPVVGEVLVDRVEPAALGGGAVQLLHEHAPAGLEFVLLAAVMRSPPSGSRAGSACRCSPRPAAVP